jgi:hypothetical protein
MGIEDGIGEAAETAKKVVTGDNEDKGKAKRNKPSGDFHDGSGINGSDIVTSDMGDDADQGKYRDGE